MRGRRAGRSERFSATASFPSHDDDHAYLPRLWASRKLGHLTRQVWLEGPTPSLVEEIKQTALRYGLPSEYTAYLVQEPNVVAGFPGPVRREGTAFSAAPPAAPAEAHGAGAVGAASRARQMRDASSAADLVKVAGALEGRAERTPGTRMAAGRLFQLREGVWVEAGSSDRLPLVTVKLFSRAWFDLIAALPEVAPAARELGRLELSGARVRLRVDEQGLELLPAARLAGLVRDFRGAQP